MTTISSTKYKAALENLKRVVAETEGQPGDEASLPEYVPVPTEGEQVVAQFVAKRKAEKKTDD